MSNNWGAETYKKKVQLFKGSNVQRQIDTFRPNQLLATVGLLELSYLLQDLFVRWPERVICFGKLPAHHSLFIDHVSGRVRPAFAIRIKKPIAINDFVVVILKQRKGLAAIVCRLKFLAQLFRVLMAVDAHRQYLRSSAILLV